MSRLSAMLAGLLFGAGLTVAGMTHPRRILSFLDLTGTWDPSLAFVMVGAIGVHFVGLRLSRRRVAPLFGGRFHLPTARDVDARLLAGAAIFGVGWGLGGYCPGPSITAAATGSFSAIVFVVAMSAGMLLQHAMAARQRAPRAPVARADTGRAAS